MTRRTRRSARTASAFVVALAAAPPALADGFASPSGNILCYVNSYDGGAQRMSDWPLTCLVFEADWTLPPYYGDDDPTCDLDRTRTLVLPPEGAPEVLWSCHGDVFWPLPLGTISYGSQWSVFGYSCDMARTGVRCRNATGQGFEVNRAGVVAF